MDVIKEMQEMRAMKAQVEELAKQGMDPKGLSQKLHLPKKEGESDLSWKTRVLTLSYASDFIDGAEAKDIQLTFQPEEVRRWLRRWALPMSTTWSTERWGIRTTRCW